MKEHLAKKQKEVDGRIDLAFEQAGFECPQIHEKNRRLIFENPEILKKILSYSN